MCGRSMTFRRSGKGFRATPLIIWTNGRSPNFIRQPPEGHSHFRTSGGRAATRTVALTLSQQSVLISPTDVDNNSNTDLLRNSLEQHLDAIRALLDSKLKDIEEAGLLILRTLE